MVRLVILFLIETHIYSVGGVFKSNLTHTVTGWLLTKKLGNATTKICNSGSKLAPYTGRVREAAGRDEVGTQSVQGCAIVTD